MLHASSSAAEQRTEQRHALLSSVRPTCQQPTVITITLLASCISVIPCHSTVSEEQQCVLPLVTRIFSPLSPTARRPSQPAAAMAAAASSVPATSPPLTAVDLMSPSTRGTVPLAAAVAAASALAVPSVVNSVNSAGAAAAAAAAAAPASTVRSPMVGPGASYSIEPTDASLPGGKDDPYDRKVDHVPSPAAAAVPDVFRVGLSLRLTCIYVAL